MYLSGVNEIFVSEKTKMLLLYKFLIPYSLNCTIILRLSCMGIIMQKSVNGMNTEIFGNGNFCKLHNLKSSDTIVYIRLFYYC